VFVGPYEHHSNEVTWREGLATVVEVRLADDGGVDLDHLEALLTDERWLNRPRIGSFSAASNVTGMKTPVHAVARLLHRHDALACFDFAASAPYVEIDMNPEGDAEGALDAVFLSPHKYLGGPGASGVLVFNERLYPCDLAPSVGGGGTVDYVGPTDHDFTADVEAREKAGTPGVLQTIRAALAVQVKHAVGVERIEAREQELLRRAFERWGSMETIEILGNPDPARRVGIVSFNLRCSNGQYLHPKLVTTLLNDLFGIQSRAGCSCAGPYGHRLLGIDETTSEKYRAWIRKGYHGIKPGWCRVGFHYVMDDAEADFIIDAVALLAREGECFVPLYRFDLDSGVWVHREADEAMPSLSLADALKSSGDEEAPLSPEQRAAYYADTLAEAEAWAARLDARAASFALDGELGELQFFTLPAEA
jgi:selenocysteine lyase/cysteine desulfurase